LAGLGRVAWSWVGRIGTELGWPGWDGLGGLGWADSVGGIGLAGWDVVGRGLGTGGLGRVGLGRVGLEAAGVALVGEVRVVGELQLGRAVLVVSAYRCGVGAGLLDLLDGR
jgi:hypothetical protein